MIRIGISVASALASALLMLFVCSCTEEEHGFVVPSPGKENVGADNNQGNKEEGADQFYDHTRNVSTFRGACEYVWSFKGSTFKENVEKYLLSIGVKQQDINDIRTIMLK